VASAIRLKVVLRLGTWRNYAGYIRLVARSLNEVDRMADGAQKRGPEGRCRVHVSQEDELQYWMQMRYWMQKWGVSPSREKEVVGAVLPIPKDVAKYLGKPLARLLQRGGSDPARRFRENNHGEAGPDQSNSA
jgi:hypothetical protein